MSKQKLVCTVELDLPDELTAAHKAQGPLLEMWSQFIEALPGQNITGVRTDSRVVRMKEPKAKTEGQPAEGAELPTFLKRA
jgi:hypothetical protein